MEISPSLSLSFSLSFVFPEFEQASEGCRQIGAESCHFKPFLQAYLKGLRGPCILGTTASKQPPSASESTCGLLIRDPAVKFMQRTFNYDTDPLCEQWQWSGGGRGRRAGRHYGRRGANCRLRVVSCENECADCMQTHSCGGLGSGGGFCFQ